MSSTEIATLVTLITGTLVTIITLVAGFVLQYLREGRAQTAQFAREARQHQWEKEDRETATAALTAHISATTQTQTALSEVATQEVKDLIAENTEISTQAFHEANTVNLKLEKLGLANNQLQADAAAVVVAETQRRRKTDT